MQFFLIQKTAGARFIAVLIALLLISESFVLGVAKAHAQEEVVAEQDTTVEQVENVESNESESNAEESNESEEEEEESTEEETEEIDETALDELTGDASIETGDAVADAYVENVANTNNTETDGVASSSDESASEETASTTETQIETEVASSSASSTDEVLFGFAPSQSEEVTASSTNEAEIDTTATVTASTGGNQASGQTAAISTGDAVAVANIVNLANTNIFNSDGFIGFFNSLGIGTTDLTQLFTVFDSSVSASTPPCADNVCGTSGSYTINNQNDANVNNSVSVTASTGGNTALAGDSASINTGNAYAAANIFNVVNTNITDSNYLLLSFNNFGSYNGDIVLPNSSVFSQLFNQTSGVAGTVVNNQNDANIDNNLDVSAETGDNQAAGGDISTGSGYASGNVVNQVNQNLFGSDSFLMVLRVHGNWSGDIFGLPEGVAWRETNRGIELFAEGQGSSPNQFSGTVNNQNNANINNDVSVYALTGDNKASENGEIDTGDAYAGGNIVNLANTNILGQNWATLVFDIFGDWNGNLSFGQPDLWVGAQAEVDEKYIYGGDKVKYTFTVTNFGDVAAENVSLRSFFSNRDLSFDDHSVLFDENGYAHFGESLGRIEPGETKTIRAEGIVGEIPKRTRVSIPLQVEVSSQQSESNMENNSDIVNVLAGKEKSKNHDPRNSFGAKMTIEKTATPNQIETLPAEVDYQITVTNTGGNAYHGLLIDTFYAPDGTILHEERWELGTIDQETIVVDYTLNFTSDMPMGVYTNEAQVIALDRHESIHHGQTYMSDFAVAEVVVGDPEGEVLGLTTSCPAYINTFMQYDSSNDSDEVLKLQQFLNSEMKAGLLESGEFDLATDKAVKNFQNKYRDIVLQPWGMAYPTGYVYLTTRKHINELYCRGEREFPLTMAQSAEIERYRYVAQQTITTPQDVSHQSDTALYGAATVPNNRRDELLEDEENDDSDSSDDLALSVETERSPSVFRPFYNSVTAWFQFAGRE